MNSKFGLLGQEGMSLGTEVFHLVSALTPMVNVDLLIQRQKLGTRETLLVWREDEFYRGWHIPGGVIRFKESMLERVRLVGIQELGVSFSTIHGPVEVSETINPTRNTRGHFISLLYICELESPPAAQTTALDRSKAKNGQWAWHDRVPNTFLAQQLVYAKYI